MASDLPHVKWPEGRTLSGAGKNAAPYGKWNCYNAAPSIRIPIRNSVHSRTRYIPSCSTTCRRQHQRCSCSCDFLSSCLTTSQSTSIDDHYYPLLDLLGYSRYGSILAIVGSKCLFSGDTACSLAILSGEGDISSGVQGGVSTLSSVRAVLGGKTRVRPRDIHPRGCLICR